MYNCDRKIGGAIMVKKTVKKKVSKKQLKSSVVKKVQLKVICIGR